MLYTINTKEINELYPALSKTILQKIITYSKIQDTFKRPEIKYDLQRMQGNFETKL